MATLALSLAGQFAGGLISGPIGATIGRALGALAGSALDGALFGANNQAPAPGIALQGASEGTAVPRIWGWNRLAGNIIWATQLERVSAGSGGLKGNDSANEDGIAASFAVGLCEGEAAYLGRIWADGELLETEGLTLRFYPGSQDQAPDELIEAKQGADQTPAYRGLCYLVFERLPLAAFGNRIPNISVELCRVIGDLEPAIRAITLIPGATEFGYDPAPRVRIVSPGTSASENTHLLSRTSDWTLSLDQLQALCPGLEHVALVVTWFGDDLRCNQCTVTPRVESNQRTIKGTSWAVSDLNRSAAESVSTHDGAPAFGGTPSDTSVLAAIADLGARGIKVTLYPFLMMDIAPGNALPDPQTGLAGQPAYPWRGRITCDPAPGATGTPDGSGAASTQITAFLGAAAPGDFAVSGNRVTYSGPAEWRYRRMVLHYAHLAELAGGIDTFLIGSEMRGLTTVRSGAETFPFVEGLITLATDLRGVLGNGTKITYAADWSEYGGLQPAGAPGDKLFHLDGLWASASIDAIGIDNYMPLSDWRDGTDHADAGLAGTSYDLAYLHTNLAGGEGYDWYYASQADREAGTRTPIGDGAHGEPWVWRFKDIVSWWQNPHHNRVGGVRNPAPTAWVPQSKPVWFTELGCGAVDKGANQPNMFADPKSAEDGRPHFSNGASDGLAQRQFLRAHLHWWRPETEGFDDAQNPVSNVYGDRMLDPGRVYLWTWDARPFPAFPSRQDVWSDGPSHATGHWLTGRLGAFAADEFLVALGSDFGFETAHSALAGPLIHGVIGAGGRAARQALEPVLSTTGLSLRDGPDGLALTGANLRNILELNRQQLAAGEGPLVSRTWGDPSGLPGRFDLRYSDHDRAYLPGTTTALAPDGAMVAGFAGNLTLGFAAAARAAETALRAMRAGREIMSVVLPPSIATAEVGDLIALDGINNGHLQITVVRDGAGRSIEARATVPCEPVSIIGKRPGLATSPAPAFGEPLVYEAHLPGLGADPAVTRLVVAGFAAPWPGFISIVERSTGAEITRLNAAASLGVLNSPLAAGPLALWDRANEVELTLYAGSPASASREAVLNGLNRALVQHDDGVWEVMGFETAILVSDGVYRFRNLLRGLDGTGPALSVPASVGTRIILFDTAIKSIDVPVSQLDQTLGLTAFGGAADSEGAGVDVALPLGPALPLPPVHLTARRDAATGDVTITWQRRGRIDAGGWTGFDIAADYTPLAFTVIVFSGANPVRTFSVSETGAAYSAADQTSDFGGLPAQFDFSVAQTSATLGPGHAAQGEFNA